MAGRKLHECQTQWEDIVRRVEPMLEEMAKLNSKFYADRVGLYLQLMAGTEFLAQEKVRLGAAAQGNAELAATSKSLYKLKQDCIAVSNSYWHVVMQVQAIGREISKLSTKLSGHIASKEAKQHPSQSLAALKTLATHIDNFGSQLTLDTMGGPHKAGTKLLR